MEAKKRSIGDGVAIGVGKKARLIEQVRGIPASFVFFSDGIWKEFPSDSSAPLLDAYRAGKDFAEIFTSCKLAVFFVHMIQLDTNTGYRNSIGWFDSSGEFWCPRQPFEGPGSVDDLAKFLCRGKANWSARQVSLGITDTTSTSCVLDNEAGEVSSTFKHCSKLLDSMDNKLKKLEAEDPNLATVKSSFLAGLGKLSAGAEVSAVYEVSYDGPNCRARREAFKNLGQLTAMVRGGDANLEHTWYGCSRDELLSIIKHGFGRPSVDSTYGVGIYLIPGILSRLSCLGTEIDENGEQHVLLCQAIIGKTELIQAGSKQFHPSSELVDTGVDNLASPKRYVVWSTHMNTHILPVYVTSFKLASKWHEFLKASASAAYKEKLLAQKANVTVPRLFAVLKPELSSSEMGMIVHDYVEFKNGKLSREEFVRRVRTLAGDEKLKRIQEQVVGSSILCGFFLCQSQMHQRQQFTAPPTSASQAS